MLLSLTGLNCKFPLHSHIPTLARANPPPSGLSFIDNGNAAIIWRFPIAFQILPLFVLFASCWYFPESPRWLVKVGREDEARWVLGRLRGESGEDVVRAESEFQDIRNSMAIENENKKTTSDSYFNIITGRGFGKLHVGRRVQLVIWLQIMQEWVGIAGVTVCKSIAHLKNALVVYI